MGIKRSRQATSFLSQLSAWLGTGLVGVRSTGKPFEHPRPPVASLGTKVCSTDKVIAATPLACSSSAQASIGGVPAKPAVCVGKQPTSSSG